MKEDLREYGIVADDFNVLRCRLCDARIPKVGVTYLLNTQVKYGWCRRWTHGVSVCKAMK